MDNGGGWLYSNIAWDFGATLVTQGTDGKYTANLNSKEDVAAMQFMKDLKWVDNAYTANPTQENWTTGFTQFGTGGAAMYMSGNDAIAQPTQTNGLATNRLSLVPIPAGPGGQFSLIGGTPYVFSKSATPDQINACLDFLEVMGKAPVATPDAIAGMITNAKSNIKNGVPVIPPSLPVWVNTDYSDALAKVDNDNSNVNMALYNDMFTMLKKPGNLKPEETDAQDVYATITKVLQAVITDKNANCQTLLNSANKDLQKLLDNSVNK
jgi:ABC-type glycerol-3-phosphate transport system substrate-binding protein